MNEYCKRCAVGNLKYDCAFYHGALKESPAVLAVLNKTGVIFYGIGSDCYGINAMYDVVYTSNLSCIEEVTHCKYRGIYVKVIGNKSIKCKSKKGAFFTLILIGILFILFTFKTPTLEIFRDPVTGTYGIPS